MAFSSDGSYLLVAVKGKLATDLNNPTGNATDGYLAFYSISNDGKLAETSSKISTPLAFTVTEDQYAPGVYLTSDIMYGYSTFRFSDDGSATVVPGNIPLHSAVGLTMEDKD